MRVRRREEISIASNPIDLTQFVLVSNVQELVMILSPVKSISGGGQHRYIRPEAEADPEASVVVGDELPIINLSNLVDLELVDQDELTKLGSMCREWGFFRVLFRALLSEKFKDITSLFG